MISPFNLLATFGQNLLDKTVHSWQKVSITLILLFALVEGMTWSLIAFDFLQNALQQTVPWVVWTTTIFIGLCFAVFVLQLDRSIFMLDLHHLQFIFWKNAAEREHQGLLEVTPPPEGKLARMKKRLYKASSRLLETLASVPLLGDLLEAGFSLIRLPVLFRLFFVGLTFIASVVGGYTTLGQQTILQKQFASTLESRAILLEKEAALLKNIGLSEVNRLEDQCRADTQNRDSELSGTFSGNRGAGINWIRLRDAAKISCDSAQKARTELSSKVANLNRQRDEILQGLEELRNSGGITSSHSLQQEYLASISDGEKSYGARFKAGAAEAGKSKFFIAPWDKESWKSVESPAQLIHFFYLIFFFGMLAVKLFQGVSNAAYFSEELQNAWADESIRLKSNIKPSASNYAYQFAQWYFRQYHLEKLREVQLRVQTQQNHRMWVKYNEQSRNLERKVSERNADIQLLDKHIANVQQEIANLKGTINDSMATTSLIGDARLKLAEKTKTLDELKNDLEKKNVEKNAYQAELIHKAPLTQGYIRFMADFAALSPALDHAKQEHAKAIDLARKASAILQQKTHERNALNQTIKNNDAKQKSIGDFISSITDVTAKNRWLTEAECLDTETKEAKTKLNSVESDILIEQNNLVVARENEGYQKAEIERIIKAIGYYENIITSSDMRDDKTAKE